MSKHRKRFCTFIFGLTMRVPEAHVQMFKCTKKKRENPKLTSLPPPTSTLLFFCWLSLKSWNIWTFEHSPPQTRVVEPKIKCTKTPHPEISFWTLHIYNSPYYSTSALAHSHKPIHTRLHRMFKCPNVQTQITWTESNLSIVPMCKNSCQIYCVVVQSMLYSPPGGSLSATNPVLSQSDQYKRRDGRVKLGLTHFVQTRCGAE